MNEELRSIKSDRWFTYRIWFLLLRYDRFKLSVIFLFFALPVLATEQADPAFTNFSKLVYTVFPPSEMLVRNRRPLPAEVKQVDEIKQSLLPVLQATARRWIRAASEHRHWSPSEQRRLFRVLDESPIWICKERCNGCGGSYGCAEAKSVAGSVASVVRIEACAFTEAGCKYVLPGVNPSYARVKTALIKSFSQIASWSIRGFSMTDFEMPKRTKAAAQQVEQSFTAIRNMRADCPDRFASSAFNLLKEENLISELKNTTLQKCVTTALEIIAAFSQHPACLSIIKNGAFQTEFREGLLRRPPALMRATPLGEWLLCQEKHDARFVKFGARWVALVPEGTCEGESVQKPLDFILSALSGVSRSGVTQADVEACLTVLAK